MFLPLHSGPVRSAAVVLCVLAVLAPAAHPMREGFCAVQSPGAAAVQDDVEALLQKLRQAADAAAAGVHAAALLATGGSEGRRGLLGVVQDKSVPLHVVEGGLVTLRVQNDAADDILAAVQEILAGRQDAEAAVRQFLGSHRDRPQILARIFERIRASGDEQVPAPLVRMTVFLVNTSVERMGAIELLVMLIESKRVDAAGGDALYELSFHRFGAPAEWRDWFERFRRTHPNGFSVLALHESAVNQYKGRVEEEARNAIGLIAKEGALPLTFLDSSRYSAATRRFAIERAVAAAGSDGERRKRIVERFAEVVDKDPDQDVRRAALSAMILIVRTEESLRDRLYAAASPLLSVNEDSATLALAVEALGLCPRGDTAQRLAAIYAAPEIKDRKEAKRVREEIFTAIVRLREGGREILRDALLGDPEPELRRAAARSLASAAVDDAQKVEAAQVLAQALGQEGDLEVRAGIVANIRRVAVFSPPEVRDALFEELRISQAGSQNQSEVVKAIVRAYADLSGAARKPFEEKLREVLPGRIEDRAIREEAARAITTAANWSRELVQSWVVEERDGPVRRILIHAWAQVSALPVRETVALAALLQRSAFHEDALVLLAPLVGQLKASERSPEIDAAQSTASWMAVRSYASLRDFAAADALIKDAWPESPPFDALLARGLRYAAEEKWTEAWADFLLARAQASEADPADRVLLRSQLLRIAEKLGRTPAILAVACEVHREAMESGDPALQNGLASRWKHESEIRAAATEALFRDETREAAEAIIAAAPDLAAVWLLNGNGTPDQLRARVRLLVRLFQDSGVEAPADDAPESALKEALGQFQRWWAGRG